MKRRPLRAWGLAALWLLAAGSAATAEPAAHLADSPQDVLGACVARLADEAGAELLKRCPQVPEALRSLGFAGQLRSDWRDRLNSSSLQDLLDLARRYRGPSLSAVPSQSMLPLILQNLRRDQPPQSWWQSFKQRLRRWLEMPQASGEPWLAQLLSALPPIALRLMLYITTITVVVMALWMVWRELRAAGLLERRGGAGQARLPLVDGGGAGTPKLELALADVDAAPPGQRAAVLLRLLLQAMRRTGRVRGERTLSCRELSERASFDSLEQRRRFASVARWAERERYAGGANEGAGRMELAAVLAQGRELYEQLHGSAAAAELRQ
jgi:hypothetical protein